MQRLIGVVLGGLLTFALLLLLIGPDGTRVVGDLTQAYLVAIVSGAVLAWAWPVAIGWYLFRRGRSRERERIEGEVQRRLSEERGRGRGD